MTAKKGGLWKTAWNRGRGTGIPDPLGPMAFFQDFASPGNTARYSTLGPSTLATSLPFWYAAVGMRYGPTQGPVSANPAFFQIKPGSVTDLVSAIGNLSGADTYVLPLAVPGDDFISASLVVVEASGLLFRFRVHLDDQVSQRFDSTGPFVPATFPISISPGPLPGAFHGFAGGSVVPTIAEIKQWFTTLKTSLKIPEIPGKTTHRYSVASIPPATVPPILPNIGSAGFAQDMTLSVVGAPTPANVLIPTRFAW
jgi:hypothetical protein